MIIRSQDKKTISDDMNLKIQGREVGKIVFFSIRNSKDIWLGSYKTMEKAIKVLDMIQKAYCRMEDIKCGAVQAQKHDSFCFDMPSDEEVEV